MLGIDSDQGNILCPHRACFLVGDTHTGDVWVLTVISYAGCGCDKQMANLVWGWELGLDILG